jgi:hypothetical protein
MTEKSYEPADAELRCFNLPARRCAGIKLCSGRPVIAMTGRRRYPILDDKTELCRLCGVECWVTDAD